LDEKPASDWPLIIDAFNRSLLYDDEGNIISIIPFYADEENGYIVLKNGQYDLPYTTQLNQEQSSQFWQSFGDQAAQLLLGISEVIGGSVLWLGSSALGAGGLALSIPSGGTVTIPAAAVASAGYVTSGTLIAGGTITVTDAISQIAAANANLQISFAKKYDEWKVAKPTSKPFGKPVEARVNGRKSHIRVDAEPDSNSVHIQVGGGKRSQLKRHIRLSEITDKKSIYQALKDLDEPAVDNLSKGKLDDLVHNIWRAVEWLRAQGG
jgi:hypothetical protein